MLKLFRRVKKKTEKYQERKAFRAKLALIQQLIRAVRASDKTDVLRALESGADINWLNPEDGNNPALFLAETRDMLQFLLDNAADPNLCGSFGRAPLAHYCLRGRPDLVECLMQAGADVNYNSERNNQNALNLTYFCQLEQHRDEILEMLVAAGADTISYDNRVHQIELFRAVRGCNTIAVRHALEAGADINWLNPEECNNPALFFTETPDMLQFLLDHGADPNLRGSFGRAPLAHYCLRGRPDLMECLMQAGADCYNCYSERTHQNGLVALHSTYFHRLKQNHDEILEMLVAAGADPTSYNSQGEAVMYVAAKHGDLKTMELLSHRAGASVNISSQRTGRTPLHVAAYYRHIEAMEWLLEAGAIVDAVDGDNMTPLALAIGQDFGVSSTVVKMLLHGADPNMIVHERRMPLLEYTCMTSERGGARVVNPLLEAGATMDMDMPHTDAGPQWLPSVAPDLYELVEQQMTAPRSLKFSAACAVRAGLRRGAGGRSILQPALALPLPPALSRYVALSGLESQQGCVD